jgi:hypothetical protein
VGGFINNKKKSGRDAYQTPTMILQCRLINRINSTTMVEFGVFFETQMGIFINEQLNPV